jgi:hypothetical protein
MWEGASVRNERTLAYGKGLVFSLQSFLEDQLVQRQLRDRLLQPGILLLKVLEPLGVVELEATLGAPPPIVTLL